MAAKGTGAVLRQVEAIYRGGSVASLTDGELLERFASRADEAVAEAAFEAIVARHGPMVLGVCRRVVPDPGDAEDAFQATFLVLARKAGLVRVNDSAGRWLYGVARKVATRARKRSIGRREAGVPTPPEAAAPDPGPLDVALTRERAAMLRDEVDRLPGRYREAVVLCHFEGRSLDEAASRLGRPVGTIKARLSRARAMLRARLSRRGLGLGVLPVVPGPLLRRTVTLAVRDACRSAPAGIAGAVVSGSVVKLAEGVIAMTGWAKVQAAGVALLSVGVTAAAVGGLAGHQGVTSDDDTPASSASFTAKGESGKDDDTAPQNLLDAAKRLSGAPPRASVAWTQAVADEIRSVSGQIQEVRQLVGVLEERREMLSKGLNLKGVLGEEERRLQAELADLRLRLVQLVGTLRELEAMTRPEVEVDLVGPEGEVIRGATLDYRVTVRNEGKSRTGDTSVIATFGGGLRGLDDDGRPIEARRYELQVGELGPGQSFGPVLMRVQAGEDGPGRIMIQVEDPDGRRSYPIDDIEKVVEVVAPALALDLEAPETLEAGSIADFAFTIANRGTMPAVDVEIGLFAPEGGEVEVPEGVHRSLEDAQGCRYLYWRLPRLDEGESHEFRVPIRLVQPRSYAVEVAAHCEGFRDPEDIPRVLSTVRVVAQPGAQAPAGGGEDPTTSPFDAAPTPARAPSLFEPDSEAPGRSPFDHPGRGPFQTERDRDAGGLEDLLPGLPGRAMPDRVRPVRPEEGASGPFRVEKEPVEPGPNLPEGRAVPEWDPDLVEEPDDGPGVPRESEKTTLPEYVVEPPDLIRIEVLEALPGRPIAGERLVRPDGRISLGFYGDVYVAGLTPPEIKEKVILHLREFLTDDSLGLIEFNPTTEQHVMIHPRESDRVLVDVSSYNSKFYYVQGDVIQPGRLNVTGNETVLDAISHVGGLLPSADRRRIRLVRPSGTGDPAEILPIDLEAIVDRGDSSTNYQLRPGDRLVVPRDLRLLVEEAFLALPEAQDLRAQIAYQDRKIEQLRRVARVPSDPGLTAFEIERKRLMDRYKNLWEERAEGLRARVVGDGLDDPDRTLGGPPPLDTFEGVGPTGDREPGEDEGGTAIEPGLVQSLRELVDRLDASAAIEQSETFTVTGGVQTPGRFLIPGELRITDALELTGGTGDVPGTVFLLRRGAPIRKFYTLRGALGRGEEDVLIQPGDQLVVRTYPERSEGPSPSPFGGPDPGRPEAPPAVEPHAGEASPPEVDLPSIE